MNNPDQEVTQVSTPSNDTDRMEMPEDFLEKTVVVADYWSGPLPSPETMADYNDVIPDGANRIVTAWEEESAHRRTMEREGLRGYVRVQLTSKTFAIIFAVTALVVTAYCAYIDKEWVATILGGGVIASVVIAFLHEPKGDEPPKSEDE